MATWDNHNAVLRVFEDLRKQQDLFERYRAQNQVFEHLQREETALASFAREQRLLASALAAQRDHFALRDVLGSPYQLRQIVDDFQIARDNLAHLSLANHLQQFESPWELTREHFESALRLFSSDVSFRDPAWLPSFERLSHSIEEAPLLGHALVEDSDATETATDDIGELAGRQLIEVIPESALADLQSVSFEPLRLLDAAVREPSVLLSFEPRAFEEFSAALYERLGMQDIILTPEKGDGGRDVIGTVSVAGLRFVVALECKRYAPDRPVGVEYARALLGTISHGGFRADKGVLITTSRFSSVATSFILTAPALDGVDFADLERMLVQLRK